MGKAATTRVGDLKRLRDAVATNSDSAAAQLRLGTALLKAGHLREAEEVLRRSVEIAPDYAEAWSNLGGLLLERWDFAGCVDVNRKASALRPDLTQAHYNEGLGHLYQGEAEEVVACFGRVVELDPNNAGGQYYLAVGLHAVGRVDEARVRLARSLALGWSPEPEFLRAMEAHGGASFEQAPTVEIGKASKDSSQ